MGDGGDYDSVQAAADAAQPGDNVAVAAGTYTGGLHVEHGGSEGKYVTFYGADGTAVLKGGGSGNGVLDLGGQGWVRFYDVTVAGSDHFGAYADGAHDLEFHDFGVDGSQDGGLVLLGVKNVLVDGCDIHGTNAEGTSADGEAMSLGEGASGLEVRGCDVHDNGEEGIDVKYSDDAQAKIHDNLVHDNRGPNLYVDGASHVQLYANTVWGTTEESKAGIMLAVENYSDSKKLADVKVFDNVVYGNANAGLTFWTEGAGTLSDVSVVNNTFAGNRGGAVSFDTDAFAGTNLLRNNVFGEGDVPGRGGFTSDHNVSGDPGFADADGHDYHLQAGSKAVDAGSADGAPPTDRDGKARPAGGGVDVGAYES